MSAFSTSVSRIAGAVILAAVAGWGVYTFLLKSKEESVITYSTSDARNLKGEFTIALDSWIGYFPFTSPVFGQLMRDDGYRVKIIDDKADYPGRMKRLRAGDVDFAVCTVDSYLLNGASQKFPGAIVAVIDESKGGDALVAWKDRIANIDELKRKAEYAIAFTPASPSEHLLRAVRAHFDAPALLEKRHRVEVDGAEEAFKRLMAKKVDAAALWEPHVSEALAAPGIVKLIGSDDMERLIVDILLVNRRFAENNPDMVKLFLKNYFETLRIYQAAPGKLSENITGQLKLSAAQVAAMLRGVRWINYAGNAQWFGIGARETHRRPELVESIHATVGILTHSGDITSDPLPDRDPYTIINSAFLRDLPSFSPSLAAVRYEERGNTLIRKFSRLSQGDWNSLGTVGSLKLRPVSFRSGTEEIDESGREEVGQIVESIRHYPNFRILIKGHSGRRGDPEANRELSLRRAKAVMDELVDTYHIDPNRIRIAGAGSAEPLPRQDGESDASYDARLKRVEIVFLSKK
ncbi:MAG TPA: phosphate ABC transporter substrate-binding/OmpA family protein [Spirochaetota bacterium]|nr:phosphate ABC transporter substrate-binding/OmpA family protein [Spirochaetota bacterium]HPU90102.1 phosphate ABC transporter substrate-binding/OmpA family protein [Spirochaetota bacterium]